MIDLPEPRWERGYRCHGYWIGIYRYGWIGCGSPKRNPVKDFGYRWSMDFPVDETATGETTTLREAKRAVEAAFKAKHSETKQRIYRIE